METICDISARRPPWNKGKLVGQKTPLKLKEIWAIRVRLQLAARHRELAPKAAVRRPEMVSGNLPSVPAGYWKEPRGKQAGPFLYSVNLMPTQELGS
jgi:hypothetical protein